MKSLFYPNASTSYQPQGNHQAKMLQDILLFDRKIKLKYNFSNDSDQNQGSSQQTNNQILHPSSGWTPCGQDPLLDTFRNSIINAYLKELANPTISKKNLSHKELQAMRDLHNNTDIIIKPTDKGRSIVIMNIIDYIQETQRHLLNPEHYKTLNAYIHHIIDQAWRLGIINETIKENLQTKNPKISTFYILPKIHKPGNPGRPIVNSIGSITEKISVFVDAHLRQFTPRIPSYVKDTTHFINIMKNIQLDPEDLLDIINVSSLYTNIPNTEGIAAINRMMEEIVTDTLIKMFISNLAHQVLTKNYFSFNGRLYEQIQGTAMGTRMAPNYAIIFMHYLEKNFLSNYPRQPKIWLRFIVDIFMIWKDGKLELDKFLAALSSRHQTIKFTHTTDQNEIPFLGTVVYRSSNRIHTRIYHKPTDQKYYLHYHSAHPRNQKNSVPYGFLIRCKRICTEDYHFEQEVKYTTN